jgi:hypothetical protein
MRNTLSAVADLPRTVFGLSMLGLALLVDLDHLPVGVSHDEALVVAVVSATVGIWSCKTAWRL